MQAYNFTIRYAPGSKNAADILSRSPKHTVSKNKNTDNYINMVSTHAVPVATTMDKIVQETAKDEILSSFITSLRTGKWGKPYRKTILYHSKQSISHQHWTTAERSSYCHTYFSPTKPTCYSSQSTPRNKSKYLLREKLWWPNISADVETTVKQCHACQTVTPLNRTEPLKPTPQREKSWNTIGPDLKGPLKSGEHILVMLDYKSHYPITFAMKRGVKSNEITRKISKAFSLFSYPEIIIMDRSSYLTNLKPSLQVIILSTALLAHTGHKPTEK